MQLRSVPIEKVHPDPVNPRSAVNDLADLTESIKAKGMLVPLLVRAGDTDEDYIVIAGHRRLRAAAEAGHEIVPVLLMADGGPQFATEVQLVENLQRKDLNPMEEARAFASLEKTGRAPAEISTAIGKSLSYIRHRLALISLPAKAQLCIIDGTLAVSVAYLLTRITDPKMLRQATADVLTKGWTEGKSAPMTFKQARDHLQRNYFLRVADAPFATGDGTLMPQAGPCTACPKNTGSSPVLFDAYRDKDAVCTDVTCWRAKTLLNWAAEVADHKGEHIQREKSLKLFLPNHSMLTDAAEKTYIDLQTTNYDDAKGRTWRRILGKQCPVPILAFSHQGRVHELVKVADVKKLEGLKILKRPTPGDSPADKAERAKQRQRDKAAMAAVHAVMEAIVAKAEKAGPSLKLARVVLDEVTRGSWADSMRHVVRRRGWWVKKKEATEVFGKRIKDLKASECFGVLMELLATRYAYPDVSVATKVIAEALNVDIKKVTAAAKKAVTKKAKR